MHAQRLNAANVPDNKGIASTKTETFVSNPCAIKRQNFRDHSCFCRLKYRYALIKDLGMGLFIVGGVAATCSRHCV